MVIHAYNPSTQEVETRVAVLLSELKMRLSWRETNKTRRVVYAYDDIRTVETERPEVQGHLQLHIEFEANSGYLRLSLAISLRETRIL